MYNEEKRNKVQENSRVPFLWLVYYSEIRESSLELPILLNKIAFITFMTQMAYLLVAWNFRYLKILEFLEFEDIFEIINDNPPFL